MERYKLILKHEYVEEDTWDISDIEEPYITTIVIDNLTKSMKYGKINAIKAMCDKLIMFIETNGEENV